MHRGMLLFVRLFFLSELEQCMMKWWGKMQQEQGHYKDKHRRDANVQDNRDDNGTVRDRECVKKSL